MSGKKRGNDIEQNPGFANSLGWRLYGMEQVGSRDGSADLGGRVVTERVKTLFFSPLQPKNGGGR